MHDVLRYVAIWITLIEKKSGFSYQPNHSLHKMPDNLQKNCRRVSFMNNSITRLPSQLLGCSELTVLFLHGNPLRKIPYGFFRGVRALRFLNLSGTHITSLPPSLLQLGERHALLLRDCPLLDKLPPLGALEKLQVLDLSGTRLRELPTEMCKLKNLRELNLSCTHHLEDIEAGTLSGLSSLEALDMSSSAYKWDVKCKTEQKTSLYELLSLEQFSVLHIRLDTVGCLALDSAWLGRLKKFSIEISPRSCSSNYLPNQHNEKVVILRGVDLMEIRLEGLLRNACALDLVTCGGIREVSEIAGRRSLCGLPGLKSLTITSCEWITELVNGENVQGSMLPNLEHLRLIRLRNLLKIVEGGLPEGGCLGKLKTIEVVDCRRLKTVISYALLCQVQNLEEIKVSDCRRMKCIIVRNVSDGLLRKLKVIEIRNLINLKTICSRESAWPVLERIHVSNCPMLERLPLSAYDATTIREIKGDRRWWDNLRWEDDKTKLSLQERFQTCSDTETLPIEDRF
jgi:disease resistance protein RPS2